MGLDIISSDETKHFHIGYIGFMILRKYFVLCYEPSLYNDYDELVRFYSRCWGTGECPVDVDKLDEGLGDLRILIWHSDCEGELSSEECKKLLPCLRIDEELIKSTLVTYNVRMIEQMREFKELIKYCACHDDVKLIFG